MIDKKKSSASQKAQQSNSKNTKNIIDEDGTKIKGNDPKKESQKDEKQKQDAKSREWWCVVYPDSAPDNWRELVQETFLEAYISPFHNKDVNPDGIPKKPHYHVVLAWSGPTTYSNAKTIMESFGGVIQPKVIGSLRGVCRYLCHLDNPEKAQYNPEDVICYNGADWQTAINLKSDKYISINEMQEFCNKYKITSFLILNTYARAHRHADWFRTLCDNGSYVMREYCKSLEWELNNNGYIPTIEDIDKMIADIDMGVDPSTGEVLEDK